MWIWNENTIHILFREHIKLKNTIPKYSGQKSKQQSFSFSPDVLFKLGPSDKGRSKQGLSSDYEFSKYIVAIGKFSTIISAKFNFYQAKP
jgi:hypothetical protein